MANVGLRLEVTRTGVADGPWAYMPDRGLTFMDNVAQEDIPYSADLQMLALNFIGPVGSKIDYILYLDNVQKKKGSVAVTHGGVGAATIRFFMKAPA